MSDIELIEVVIPAPVAAVEVAVPPEVAVAEVVTGLQGLEGIQGEQGIPGPQGDPGTTDHGMLTGLADDDHPQYHTDARGDARYDAIGSAADVAADLASHEAASDPHPQYLTSTEGNATYSLLSHTHAFADLNAKPTTLAGYGIIDAQPLDSDLTAIAALTTTTFGRAFLALADEAAFKAAVNLEIGTDVQAYDADLTTWAGLTPSANAQSLVTAADYAAMRALLDLEAGTDFYSIAASDAAFQPLDGDLTAIAALSTTGFLKRTGSNTWSLVSPASTDVSDFTEAAQDAAASLLTTATHTGITATYDDTNGKLTLVVTASGGTTTIVFQTNITDFKDSILVATTANITLSGEQTIDGVLTSASRVLVKNQTAGAQNGIYVSAAGAWSRATDADVSAEVTGGMLVFCESGDTNTNKLFVLTTADPITLDTTALVFDSIALPSNPEIVKAMNSTSYTLLAADPNKWLACSNAADQTITVPNASTKIAVNSAIWGKKEGAGNVIFAAAGGVTIDAPQGLTLSKLHGLFRLKKIANNRWSLVFIGNMVVGTDVQAYDADTLKADTADNLTAGFTASAFSAGTKSSGTFTPNPDNGNLQYAVNGGAHTLAPPSLSGGDALTMVIQYTNNGSAGTITTPGFTKVTGDTISTTNGDDFFFFITVINGFSHLHVQALQ